MNARINILTKRDLQRTQQRPCLFRSTISLPQKRADYLLRPDFATAVVEAKAAYKNTGDGLQQAKEYAQILGLKFAYAANGPGIVEHDFTTGLDNDLPTFPSTEELGLRRMLKSHFE